MQRSARRLALPELPTEYFIDSIKQLIAVDAAWVPSQDEASLYLRPFMFAKEAFLGVRPAAKVNYYLIASPAGAYFSGGITPLEIWLSTKYTRAGHGGMGQAKTGGNYAASLVAQAEAFQFNTTCPMPLPPAVRLEGGCGTSAGVCGTSLM